MAEDGQMSARLKHIRKVLGTLRVQRRANSTSEVLHGEGEWLHIGDVKVPISRPASAELVPRLYANPPLSQVTLRHLKWMFQKDALGQDVFLLGVAGPCRRRLAMAFCELLGREVEYVSLSRDTTETDLKQRREIVDSTVHYVDQSAVRAALYGRVLVLDGIEKTERNVLPVLNNLLENREMQLDDGRLIVAPDRYDTLKQEHGEDTLVKWKIVRVNENFRVIALGLPVPPYKGNPLDPPLRSRFQARTVFQTPHQAQLEALREKYPTMDDNMLSSIVSVSTALHSLSQSLLTGGPVDLSHRLDYVVQSLMRIPTACPAQLFQSLYPSELLGTDALMKDALQKFGLSQVSGSQLTLSDVETSSDQDNNVTLVLREGTNNSLLFGEKLSCSHSVAVPGWMRTRRRGGVQDKAEFTPVADHEATLTQMLLSHQTSDFCLVGGKGTGKTSLVTQFADILGYEVEPITLYQDMTSRELLQQRTTLDNGDTSWRLSPLVEAALKGRLVVMDGLHRVDTGTLAVLNSLIQDRSLNLMDGTRLLDKKCYEATKASSALSDKEMSEMNIFAVHPNFRLVGVGETHKSSSAGQQSGSSPSLASWITPELISMFHFHHVKPLPMEQEKQVIMSKVPGFDKQQLDAMLGFVQSLRSSQDPTLQSLSSSLSTRQLLRIARQLSSQPSQSLHLAINKACLSRFLPQLTKNALQQALSSAGIAPPGMTHIQQHMQPVKCEIKDGYLHIGQTSVPVSSHDAAAMVPNVLFYDNELHLRIMEDMVKDFLLGEHLLLVGNQGVGKNKIVDRFLHLLNLPREYLQLHRDSTVQTLTLQPSVQRGMVTYQDSPLVRALQTGMVLVVDEADKAPTHVTCILKNIIEHSEITLADGRRVVHTVRGNSQNEVDSSKNILVHPNFRMIVLANRPGFPFLGNDFFASLGDIFSCHAVDNPDLESEKAMLRKYGSSVDESILTKLVSAFAELRLMADEELIAYPYSTREVVNIVKHIQAYPNEGIGSIVRNVFDFDSYNPDLLEVVLKVLHKHGIPAGADRTNIQLAPQFPLPKSKLEGRWVKLPPLDWSPEISKLKVSLKGPFKLNSVSVPIERYDSRGYSFSEMKSYCTLPLHETNHVSSVCSSVDAAGTKHLHAVTGHPVLLYSLPVQGSMVTCASVDDYIPPFTGGLGYWKPLVSAHTLTGSHKDKVMIHEKKTDILLVVKPGQNEVWRVNKDSFVQNVREMISRKQTASSNTTYQLCEAGENRFATFLEDSSVVAFLDFSGETPEGWSLTLPITVQKMLPTSKDQWLLSSRIDAKTNRFYILDHIRTTPTLSELDVKGITPTAVHCVGKEGLSEELFEASGLESDSMLDNSLLAASVNGTDIALVLKNLPIRAEKEVEVYTVPNSGILDQNTSLAADGQSLPLIMSSIGEILYPVTTSARKDSITVSEPGLIVVDLLHQSWRRMVLPVSASPRSVHHHKQALLHLTALDDSTVAAVDSWGTFRIVETGLGTIQNSLDEWQKMVGDDEKELQVTHSRDSGLDVSSPKHGKVDAKNEPHVGGNTWAGGTGGRDTAGLGGKGGPYRLDAGHDVHQLSDEEKKNIPDEVKQKAREMGQKARRERMREIEMNEHDADLYAKTLGKVRNQIQALRTMLSSIESKNKERQWIRHQTSGDLDERKLIDGLTGERSIYKRRGEKEPDFNSEQVFPTCVRLVVDVSGSMYRFNGHDGRLDRTVEAVLMVMEACQKLQNYKIDIVGHSGDSDEIPFVNSSSPPANDKERLQVLKSMIAESQFCWSGDHTLEATRTAMKKASEAKAEQRYVIVLSDANFSRYGIRPADFANLMVSDPLVNVYAIFIGSLGNQAMRLKSALPAGTSYICMENKDLPNILKSIFSSIN